MQRKVAPAGREARAPGQAAQVAAAADAESAKTQRPDQTPMQRPKLFGAPVLQILSRTAGEKVGYLYEWDNGERQPLWLSDPVEDVRYVPLQQPVSPPGDDPSRT